MVEKKEIDFNIDYYNKNIVNDALDELAEAFYPSDESGTIMPVDLFDEYFNNFLDQLSNNFERD